jgi:hypothetical protein
MTPLRRKMLEDMRLRDLAAKTPALTKCPRPLATSARGFSGAGRPGRRRPSGSTGAAPVPQAERDCDVLSRATVS